MIELKLHTGRNEEMIFRSEEHLTIDRIWKRLENKGLPRDLFYIQHNGRLVADHETLIEGSAVLVPRLFGGKGGFGSMLRAIGAQIEKTTNREACRDLSGRRLRDINEEKRLKAWIEKQESREEEEVERKKRKLQKLCAVPKHEFKDQRYEEERSGLTDRVHDSVEEGFKMAAITAAACEEEKRAKEEAKSIKRKTILDDDIDSDELGSSDDSDEEDNANPRKKLATESKESTDSEAEDAKLRKKLGTESKESSDSGCSSEDSRKVCIGSDRSADDISESSCSNQVSDSRDSSASDKSPEDIAANVA